MLFFLGIAIASITTLIYASLAIVLLPIIWVGNLAEIILDRGATAMIWIEDFLCGPGS